MADCCSSTLNLGCVGFCGTISTGVLAPATGTYVISLIGAGGYASFDFTEGEEITFTNPFNEDSVAVFQILRSGNPIEDEAEHDCFQVQVTAGINLVEAATEEQENTFQFYLDGELIDSFTSSDNLVISEIYP